MSRSLKKGAFVHPSILKKIEAMNKSGKKSSIKTWSRSSTITPEMIGIMFLVHNGKTFKEVLVIENMVGHKLGEFSPTRTFRTHGGKMAKDQAAAAAAASKAAVTKAQDAPAKK